MVTICTSSGVLLTCLARTYVMHCILHRCFCGKTICYIYFHYWWLLPQVWCGIRPCYCAFKDICQQNGKKQVHSFQEITNTLCASAQNVRHRNGQRHCSVILSLQPFFGQRALGGYERWSRPPARCFITLAYENT